ILSLLGLLYLEPGSTNSAFSTVIFVPTALIDPPRFDVLFVTELSLSFSSVVDSSVVDSSLVSSSVVSSSVDSSSVDSSSVDFSSVDFSSVSLVKLSICSLIGPAAHAPRIIANIMNITKHPPQPNNHGLRFESP